eukprot:RCo049727
MRAQALHDVNAALREFAEGVERGECPTLIELVHRVQQLRFKRRAALEEGPGKELESSQPPRSAGRGPSGSRRCGSTSRSRSSSPAPRVEKSPAKYLLSSRELLRIIEAQGRHQQQQQRRSGSPKASQAWGCSQSPHRIRPPVATTPKAAEVLTELVTRYTAVVFLRAARKEAKVSKFRSSLLEAALREFALRLGFDALRRHALRVRENSAAAVALDTRQKLSRCLAVWRVATLTSLRLKALLVSADVLHVSRLGSQYLAELQLQCVRAAWSRRAEELAEQWRTARFLANVYHSWRVKAASRQQFKRAVCGFPASLSLTNYAAHHCAASAMRGGQWARLHTLNAEVVRTRRRLELLQRKPRRRAAARARA